MEKPKLCFKGLDIGERKIDLDFDNLGFDRRLESYGIPFDKWTEYLKEKPLKIVEVVWCALNEDDRNFFETIEKLASALGHNIIEIIGEEFIKIEPEFKKYAEYIKSKNVVKKITKKN